MILEELQDAASFVLNTWLVNSFVAISIGHVLHPATQQ